MNNNNQSIVQWNCRGITNKKDEILHLIQIHQPLLITFQETKLSNNNSFHLPGYNFYDKVGHFNRTLHGGVAIAVHQDVPHSVINLNTIT